MALGRVPSGLFIVTTAHAGKRAGYLASWAQQASFKPLIFSIACHPGRYPYQLIKPSARFGLNLIPENDKILIKKFARGHGPDEDPIAEVSFTEVNGVPLLSDAIGGAVFSVVSESRPGDHVIIFGEANAGRLWHDAAKPWIHVRQSALGY